MQYPSRIKSPEICRRGTYLNMINATYDKPTASVILNQKAGQLHVKKERGGCGRHATCSLIRGGVCALRWNCGVLDAGQLSVSQN